MNRSFHNIEYKPFHGKKYRVGYGGGSVWHIYRVEGKFHKPYYSAIRQGTQSSDRFEAATLAAVSVELGWMKS